MYERPTPKTNFEDVGEFHEKFGLYNTNHHDIGPQPWNPSLLEFRAKFLQEEVNEFLDGMEEGDHAQMFDALLDLVYVALGTAHFLGYPWQMGWNRVQAANMAKVRAQSDGSDSKRGSSFDVVKPEGWTPPNIEALLVAMGWPASPPPLDKDTE